MTVQNKLPVSQKQSLRDVRQRKYSAAVLSLTYRYNTSDRDTKEKRQNTLFCSFKILVERMTEGRLVEHISKFPLKRRKEGKH